VIEKSRQVISKWKEIVANEEQEQEQERGSPQGQGLCTQRFIQKLFSALFQIKHKSTFLN
jgi:hypothetical protein